MKIKKIMILMMALCVVMPAWSVENSNLTLQPQSLEERIRATATTVFWWMSLAFQVYSMKYNIERMKSVDGESSTVPLESSTHFKQLNREVHRAIKTLALFYKFPESFKKKIAPQNVWFFVRYWQSVMRWWEGASRYVKPYSGILLYGEPGGGKTEYIRAIAGEGIPVFALSGSEIQNPYVGGSEAILRNLYANADAHRYGGWIRWLLNKPLHPCVVVFLDEVDSIGGARGGSAGGWGTHQTSVLNQLLTLLDGSKKNDNIITIVATNREDMLDSALVRSGRLDVKIEVKNPTKQEKKAIINHKFDSFALKRSQSLDSLFDGSGLDDMSTADCAHIPNICNTILTVDALEKEEDSKFKILGQKFWTKSKINALDVALKAEGKRIKVTLQPGRATVDTKTFKEALVWMAKEKKDHPMQHLYV